MIRTTTTARSRLVTRLLYPLLFPFLFASVGVPAAAESVEGLILSDGPYTSRFDGEMNDDSPSNGVLYIGAKKDSTLLAIHDRYEGPFANGIPLAAGTYFYQAGATWKGAYAPIHKNVASIRPNGAGVLTTAAGVVYRGMVRSNAFETDMDGEAQIDWPENDAYGRVEYQGEVSNFLPHGRGTMTWKNRHYTGEFAWGKPHGNGTMRFESGDTLQGDWRYGAHAASGWHPHRLAFASATRTVNGLRWPDGGVYEGALANNRPHGNGAMTWANGDHFDGEWQNGRRHGQGTQINIDGSQYAGEWKNDREDGFGRAEWRVTTTHPYALVSHYLGYWAAGMPEGRGERSWMKTFGKFEDARWMTGPFAPEREEMRVLVMELLGMAEWEEAVIEHAYGYTGLWRAGRFHGEGMLRHRVYDTKVYAQFLNGRLEGKVNANSKIGNEKWAFHIRDGKLDGDWGRDRRTHIELRQYRNGNLVPGSKFHQSKQQQKTVEEDDDGLFGLLAGAAMFAGLKSVGADSATALEGAMALGSDVNNNTISATTAFTAEQEKKYLALKRENDEKLQQMLAENQRRVDEERRAAGGGRPAPPATTRPATAAAAPPAPAQGVGLAARDTSATSTNFEPGWLGTYRSNLCPDTCYWRLDEGGRGEWSAGLGYGTNERAVRTPIRWEVIQKVSNVQEVGYMLRVVYLADIPEDVRKTMTHEGQSRDDNRLRVYGSATDGRCCWAQFYGQLNAVYKKQ